MVVLSIEMGQKIGISFFCLFETEGRMYDTLKVHGVPRL